MRARACAHMMYNKYKSNTHTHIIFCAIGMIFSNKNLPKKEK